jgi:hypothetical protein
MVPEINPEDMLNVNPKGKLPSMSEYVSVPGRTLVFSWTETGSPSMSVWSGTSKGVVVTVNVNVWLALVPTPLLATNVRVYVPLVPTAGVPLSVAVPLSTSERPAGRVPISLTEGAGVPVVVIWNEAAWPAVNQVLLVDVIVGAEVESAGLTVSVKVCVALLPMPLLAVSVRV